VSEFRPMVGHLLILVIFVEGPPGSTAALSEREKTDALLNVYRATGLLRRLSDTWGSQQVPPVKRLCGFTVLNRSVRVALDPGQLPVGGSFSDVDAKWLEATTDILQLTGGSVFERVERLRQGLIGRTFLSLGVADAFPLFVTNYPCSKPGHAPNHRMVIIPWTVVSATQTGNVDGVIAHEIGHVFGAPDEYGHCVTSQVAGFFDTANTNCALVQRNPDIPNTGPRARCIMDQHAHALCPVTPIHWGWADADHDGLPDLMAPATVQGATRSVTPGTTEIVNGRNVWDARAVLFGDEVVGGPFKINSPTSIEVSVPASASGTVTISLLTRAGMSTPAP